MFASLSWWEPGTTQRWAGQSRRRWSGVRSIDLATVGELAATVEPYVHADGTKIWSLMQLERQLRPPAAEA